MSACQAVDLAALPHAPDFFLHFYKDKVVVYTDIPFVLKVLLCFYFFITYKNSADSSPVSAQRLSWWIMETITLSDHLANLPLSTAVQSLGPTSLLLSSSNTTLTPVSNLLPPWVEVYYFPTSNNPLA
ncbi:hypothetical protein JRQ81_011721, partial [Phrynocephalus forsythii]